MRNPVTAAKSGATSLLGYVRAHPVAFILGGMIFAAFAAPAIFRWLGAYKAAGKPGGKLIPGAFTTGAGA